VGQTLILIQTTKLEEYGENTRDMREKRFARKNVAVVGKDLLCFE
jgi:hypothetical protein